MTENPVPRGRDLYVQESLDALQMAESTAIFDSALPHAATALAASAIVAALRALTYATLAAGEPPTFENKMVATFGETVEAASRHMSGIEKCPREWEVYGLTGTDEQDSSHACILDPDHDGDHRCNCGSTLGPRS